MGMGGVLFAVSAVQAVSSIGQGYAQKAENNFNATVLEGQAAVLDAQSDIEQGRFARMKGQYMSTSMANIGASGILPQGSALSVMLDAQTQINIDQAISKFNYQTEKNYTLSQAESQRRSGKAAVRAGYSNAFSQLLTGATNYATYKSKPSTFDSNTASARRASGGGLYPMSYGGGLR